MLKRVVTNNVCKFITNSEWNMLNRVVTNNVCRFITNSGWSMLNRVVTMLCVVYRFITNSGWNMLNKWLQEAKDTDNTVFILELLKVYQSLPVSVEDLKKDNTARFIKGLTKHANAGG